MDSIVKDIRYGFRSLMKRPEFTAIALIALALGIGANTAIFSLVNAVVLQPLPFPEPDRLVWVYGNIRNVANRASVSPPDFLDFRSQNKTFEQFGASGTLPNALNLTGNGDPERLTVSIDAFAEKSFVWCWGERSVDVCGDHAGVIAGGADCLLHPRASRDEGRSVGGAALRIGPIGPIKRSWIQ